MNEGWYTVEYNVLYRIVKVFNDDVWPFVISLMTITAMMETI